MRNTNRFLSLAALLILISAARPAFASEELAVFSRPYPITTRISAAEKAGAVVFDTGFSREPAAPYDQVMVQGEMPEDSLELQLSVGSKFLFFGTSDKFSPDTVRRFPDGRFWARFSLPEASREPLRLRAVNKGVARDHSFVVYEVEPLSASRTGDGPDVTGSVPPRDPSIYLPAGLPFPIVRRQDWKAAPPKEPYEAQRPARITFHHTAGRKPATVEAAYEEVRFIQDYHQNGKKWNDIGYHFVLDPFGTIFEGRPFGAVGAHVLYQNADNIGISIMGNYHPPASDVPEFGSLKSLTVIAAWLAGNYAIPAAQFFGHRDLGPSSCPGDLLYARKAELADAIFAPAPAPVRTPEPAGIDSPALTQLENWGHNTNFDGR